VLEVVAFCLDTCTKATAPLPDCSIDNALVRSVDPVSSIFFINRFSPLSDHDFVGNSHRKRFAP